MTLFWFSLEIIAFMMLKMYLLNISKKSAVDDGLTAKSSDFTENVDKRADDPRNNLPKCQAKLVGPHMPIEQSALLNLLVKQIFMDFLENGANANLKDFLNEEFKKLEKNSKMITNVFVKKLDIGGTVPEIKNIRILPTDPAKKDFELSGKFIYMGGFSMELYVQLQLYSAVEARISAKIIECFGDMLFKIAFEENGGDRSSPPALTIFAAFLEQPILNIDIQSNLGNYKDLPIVTQVINGAIKHILGGVLVDPNGSKWRWIMDYVSENPTRRFQHVRLTKMDKQMSILRKKKIGSYIAPVIGRFFVTVHEAINLPTGDQQGNTGFFCVVSFNRQTKKTKAVASTCNPRWAESFVFDVTDSHDNVVFSLYSRDRLGKTDFIGHTMVVFRQIPQNASVHFAETLTQSKLGTIDSGKSLNSAELIRFNLMFEPFDNSAGLIKVDKGEGAFQFSTNFEFIDIYNDFDVYNSTNAQPEVHMDQKYSSFTTSSDKPNSNFLSGSAVSRFYSMTDLISGKSKLSDANYLVSVYVRQARGLMACDNGSSDPYCLVTVGRSRKRTKTMKRILSPLWNEILNFPSIEIPNEVSVEIYDWNRFSQHSFMGEVILPLKDVIFDDKNNEVIVPPSLKSYKSYVLKSREEFKHTFSVAGAVGVSGEIEIALDISLVDENDGRLYAEESSHGDIQDEQTIMSDHEDEDENSSMSPFADNEVGSGDLIDFISEWPEEQKVVEVKNLDGGSISPPKLPARPQAPPLPDRPS